MIEQYVCSQRIGDTYGCDASVSIPARLKDLCPASDLVKVCNSMTGSVKNAGEVILRAASPFNEVDLLPDSMPHD